MIRKYLIFISVFLFPTFIFAAPQQSFEQFVTVLQKDAKKQGISNSTIEEAFKNIHHLQEVIDSDHMQAEFTNTFDRYITRAVSETRVAKGKTEYETYHSLLMDLENNYHVQPQYILALWGLETNYGQFVGDIPEFSALATLAYDHRRSTYFKKQFFSTLKIVDKNLASINDMHGSWAGAMGQCQFMPTAFLALAVDYDHTGKANIWNNVPDVLASIANFIHQAGWDPRAGVVYPVTLTKTIATTYLSPKYKTNLHEWKNLGVRLNTKQVLPKGDYSLLLPAEKNSPAYLVYTHNFDIILQWNHSNYYALAVGLLAQKLST